MPNIDRDYPLSRNLIIAASMVISIGIAIALYKFGLPHALMFIMAIPLPYLAKKYPVWLAYVALVPIIACSIWLGFSDTIPASFSLATTFFFTIVITISIHTIHKIQKEVNILKHFHFISDLSPGMEIWQDHQGSITYISPACESITGYSQEDFMQNPKLLTEIINLGDRKYLKESENTNKGETEKFDIRISHRNGTECWVEWNQQLVFNENGIYQGKRINAYDITRNKTFENSLRSDVERLSFALESSEDGVWDANLITGQTKFSDNYARKLGLESQGNEFLLQDFHNLVHPDDLPGMLKTFMAHLQEKTDLYQAEYRVRNAAGEWKWILDRGRVVQRSPKHKPIRMIGTHIDITERKNIEEALHQSEKKFRQLTENMREVFWLRSRNNGQYIYINPAFNEVWGRSCDTLYQEPKIFLEGIHPEDFGRVFHAQKELYEKRKVFNEEFRILHPAGTTRWVWVREYPIEDTSGNFYRTAGVAEDITERKQTEAALKESEKRYRDLIEHQGGGVSIIDPSETIIYINPAGEDVFGVTRGSLTGHSLGEFLDDEQFSFLKAQSAIRRQGVESSFEIIITRPDNEKRNLLVTSTPRFDANGQFLGTIAIFRDITLRKQKEDRLRYISLHDALTGLCNRSYFEDEISQMDNDENRYPVSVIMIDVDGLKQVNDQQGHSRGDELLVRVANVLRHSIRSGDILARIGGDEFAILLPNANEEALQKTIDRLYVNVESENQMTDRPFLVSISVGGHTCHQPGIIKQAVDLADAQMYRIKEQKKNGYYMIIEPKQ